MFSYIRDIQHCAAGYWKFVSFNVLKKSIKASCGDKATGDECKYKDVNSEGIEAVFSVQKVVYSSRHSA